METTKRHLVGKQMQFVRFQPEFTCWIGHIRSKESDQCATQPYG